jgi:hypothetical protein
MPSERQCRRAAMVCSEDGAETAAVMDQVVLTAMAETSSSVAGDGAKVQGDTLAAPSIC